MNYTPGPNNPYPIINHPVHQASVPLSANAAMFVPPSNGLSMVTPPDIAMIARQGYLQQQQQLAAMGQYGVPGSVPSRQLNASETAQIYGITPQMQQEHLQRQLQLQAHAAAQAQAQQQHHQQQAAQGQGKKKRGPKPSAGAQMISRQTQNLGPAHTSETYVKNALSAPPGHGAGPAGPSSSPLATAGTAAGPAGAPVEPWADSLDELDPREIAMGRFRRRHEVLGEVFGPESIKDIPTGEYDPWEGLGIDGETLEAKVFALERENQELESRLDTEVIAFKDGLQAIDLGVGVSAAVTV